MHLFQAWLLHIAFVVRPRASSSVLARKRRRSERAEEEEEIPAKARRAGERSQKQQEEQSAVTTCSCQSVGPRQSTRKEQDRVLDTHQGNISLPRIGLLSIPRKISAWGLLPRLSSISSIHSSPSVSHSVAGSTHTQTRARLVDVVDRHRSEFVVVTATNTHRARCYCTRAIEPRTRLRERGSFYDGSYKSGSLVGD